MSVFEMNMKIEVQSRRVKYDFGRSMKTLSVNMKRITQRRIINKINLQGGSMRENAPATVKKKGFSKWMYETGKWLDNGIIMKPEKFLAKIIMNPAKHKKGITYQEIGLLHNGKFAEWRGVSIPGKEGGEFWGIGQDILDYYRSGTFQRLLAIDAKRSIESSPWYRQRQ